MKHEPPSVTGPVSHESHRRALPNMIDLFPPQKNQVWRIGDINIKIIEARPVRLFVRDKKSSAAVGDDWSEIKVLTREALANAELVAGPGSRHTEKQI